MRARLTGRVVDAAGAPVGGAAVAVEGSSQTVTTDPAGRFAIDDAPIGASLIATKDGYALGLGADGQDIVLVPEAAGETITVRGAPPPASHGAARLSRGELQRIPGTGNDIVRTLSAMPGVASYPLPLGSTGVVIRGSAPEDSKLLIDGFEVPSLYHDLGFRAVVPAEAIDSLEYVPGGFDVSFGRAASGIVNLTTRAGDERRSEQFEVSGSEGSVLAQGSFGCTSATLRVAARPAGGGACDRGRYMIALRRSTIDFLLPALMPDDLDLSLTTVPRYYDGQLRLDYQLSPRWTVRLSSLGSDDALELYASKDRNADKRFANRTRFARLTAAAAYHDGPWTANLALSGIAQQVAFERGLYQHLEVTSPGLAGRAEIMRTASRVAGLTDVAWRAGAESAVTHHAIDMALPRERRDGEQAPPDDPMDTSTRFMGDVTTRNAAAWTSVAASLDARMRLTGGLRVDRFGRTGEAIVQPRGELAIKLRPGLTARVSAGGYSRPSEHQTELLVPGLRAERATQLIAGALYEPREGLRIQASTYYTDRSRLIARDSVTGALANTGRGTTIGGELLATLSRGPWFGWLAYAYSHSTRIDAPGTARRLFDYDQPHSVNAAVSYKWKRWQLGARFRAHSGLPATPVADALFDSDANLYLPAYGEVNSTRAPIHHQLDIRIDKSWHWGPVKMTKFLDVQNVYLNDTVVGYFYNFDYTQRAAFRSLPIVPTAGLRGEF